MQRGSSHNVNDVQLTDEMRSREGNRTSSQQPGVLAMIYEKDQRSKESQKSHLRHSILDEVNGDNEIAVDSESADADSARRRRNGAGNLLQIGGFPANHARTEDLFRQKQQVGSLKDAAAHSSSARSYGEHSHADDSKNSEAQLSDNADLLDQINILDPQNNR